MRRKELVLNVATGITALCSLIVTCLFVYRQLVPTASAPVSNESMARKDRNIPDWQQQIALGRRIGPVSAAVTILYYGDFECPACGAFTRRVEDFRITHPSDISIVFRHFPLTYHRNAYASARAAECGAAQGRFEQMYKILYAKQDSLGRISYGQLAKRANMPDLALFDSCTSDTSAVVRVERDIKAGRDAKIPGTPGVIVNGMLLLEKSLTVADLEQLVREARASRK
jgi:protein-disulfide isomerase